ncbi:MAG: 50S ribosomal protein L10 [Desulfobacterota bacterium]|nr:50S ribosomal protein L10 [Thermodesulfobacteriota bacterium]
MSRKAREEAVAALAERLGKTKGLIVCDYTGLNVEKITMLRRRVRDAGAELKVVKNTLLKIATRDTAYAALHDMMKGQTAIAFVDGDPAHIAKVLTQFVKDNPDLQFRVRSGVLEQHLLQPQQIEQIGNLPSREVLLGQLVGVLSAPLAGLVTVLAGMPRKFLCVLQAISEKKKA